MAARNRLPPWHEMIRTADGREVLIRPIRPEDAVPLGAALPLLQPDELHGSFLQGQAPTAATLERLSKPDPRREFTLVASEPLQPGEAVIGAVARVGVLDGTGQGEFAILVGGFLAGKGLGRHLMRRLVRWAKGKKLDRLYGEVAEDNQPMLALAESLGFRREATTAPGYVRVVLDL
ncbi:MAG: GNAT family N-acetyltransferase [Lysobacteraceae bacterium]|nr:MAG: GNAT family N-acetyltransferase [Xanthomonadaceae bacterium]